MSADDGSARIKDAAKLLEQSSW